MVINGTILAAGLSAQGTAVKRVDGTYMLAGLDSNLEPVIVRLNSDGTLGGRGTVTSVAIGAPSIFSVAGSPIITDGTITITLATQTAKTFLGGPTSGAAAAPTFRAIATADLGTGTQNSTTFFRGDGTYSNALAGVLLLVDGSSGAPSYAFSTDATTGLYKDTAGIAFTIGSTRSFAVGSTGPVIRDSFSLLWGSSIFTTPDVGISRELANQLEIHTGTPGTFGYLKVQQIIVVDASTMVVKRGGAWNNGAGAQVATLTNGPTAGNPTKWIPVDDNGTTRYIPAW